MLNANFNLALTKALRTVINGNIGNFWIQSAVDERLAKTQQLLYSATLSNSYTFKNDWIVSASLYLYGKNLAPAQIQGTVNGYIASGFSMSKSLLKKNYPSLHISITPLQNSETVARKSCHMISLK